MRTAATLALVMFFTLTAAANASVFLLLDDPADDREMVRQAASQPAVEETRGIIKEMRGKMSRWKDRDFAAVFGPVAKSAEKPAVKWAMPVAQERALGLSGLRYADKKMNHDAKDTYAIGDIGQMEVFFDIDGVTPAAMLFYLPVDADFVKAGPGQGVLGKRLAWEKPKLEAMNDWIAERWRAVYKYEVDAAREREQSAGEFSRNMKTKLAAWKELGEKNGWKLEVRTGEIDHTRSWDWYDRQGQMVRRAYTYSGGKVPSEVPNVFIWLYPGTGKEMRHEEGMGPEYLNRIEWRRADGTVVRSECREHGDSTDPWRSDTWSWAGRTECDSNGDGIPDRWSNGLDAKQDEPLAIEKSWAVHPELIPKESQIHDEQRAIPVRVIPKRPVK